MSTEVTIKYSTKDLNQAAFLWCQKGTRLLNILRQDRSPDRQKSGQGGTVFFEFLLALSETDLSKLLMAYTNGETIVEPNVFASNQVKLRNLLRNTAVFTGESDD